MQMQMSGEWRLMGEIWNYLLKKVMLVVKTLTLLDRIF
jgi:hypothetical protein